MLRNILCLFAALSLFTACDNEVDLNADFEETTVVYGFLNTSVDTQFIRINKAFLEDGANAIELAKETDRLFYESLEVRLIDRSIEDTIQLSVIEKPKDDGIFANDRNPVYFTTDTIKAETRYDLFVEQPNGQISTSSIVTIDEIGVSNPSTNIITGDLRPLTFINRAGTYTDYEFEFDFTENISEVQLNLYFTYLEEVDPNDPNRTESRTIMIPVGGLRNSLLRGDKASITLVSETFYSAIATNTPNNGNRKVIPNKNIRLEIIAVDPIFGQYTSVYGPLDGLAQVRPEFTNITNGVGLFSSRSIYSKFTFLSDPSKQELIDGPITGNLNFDFL